MFGMFIHYDLTSSTQYSLVDSIWPSIILIIIIFIVVIIRSRGKSVLDFFANITSAPRIILIWLLSVLFNVKIHPHQMAGMSTNSDSDVDALKLKENLHLRITKMLDENDKYDKFTVDRILKELEKIKKKA